MRISILLSFLLLPFFTPGQSVLFVHGELYNGAGQYYPDGMLGFKDGKITIAGYFDPKINTGEYDQVVDLKGKFIYPGFIVPNTTLGLTEVDAVRSTRDFHEVGPFNPNVRSQIAYNAESVIIPTLRNNGVLMAQVVPRGGVITGTSSVMKLEGWNWEDATYRADDGIHVNWPAMFRRTGWWAEPGVTEGNKKREKELRDLTDFFRRAKAYASAESPAEIDLRMESMRKVFAGEATVYFHADYAKELMEIVGFVKEMQIRKAVIVGGLDSWRIPELLKENNIAVIINRVHDLPQQEDDPIDLPFRLPYLLQKAGVLYCMSYEGDMEAMGGRNLPFTAGTAVGFGLDPRFAVQAITGNTAKILGIDERTGTLEPGKDATFFISAGDALDMRTNQVEQAYLEGKLVTLGSRQEELYIKFRERNMNKH